LFAKLSSNQKTKKREETKQKNTKSKSRDVPKYERPTTHRRRRGFGVSALMLTVQKNFWYGLGLSRKEKGKNKTQNRRKNSRSMFSVW